MKKIYPIYVEYHLCLQAVQKTFHNLLLLLSIFDLVRTENHRYLCRTLSDLSSSSPSPQSTSPSQVYLVTTVPLFSLPQLSSSTEVKHFLTLILPYVLPVAHIGMVITRIFDTCGKLTPPPTQPTSMHFVLDLTQPLQLLFDSG